MVADNNNNNNDNNLLTRWFNNTGLIIKLAQEMYKINRTKTQTTVTSTGFI
jgi:hypothetical protein